MAFYHVETSLDMCRALDLFERDLGLKCEIANGIPPSMDAAFSQGVKKKRWSHYRARYVLM